MSKKDKTLSTIILLGALGLGGYFLYKTLSGSSSTGTFGGYSSGWIPGDTTPQTPINNDSNLPQDTTPKTDNSVVPVPYIAPSTQPQITTHTTPTTQSIVVTPIASEIMRPTIQYGTTVNNIEKTITIPAPIGVTNTTLNANQTTQTWTGATYGQPGQPSVTFLQNVLTPRTTTPTTQIAQAAVAAAAPPRMVAKILAGKVY